ncbi:MAG: hypothetical protein U1F52_05090 [Burkholderiales bacterium]
MQFTHRFPARLAALLLTATAAFHANAGYVVDGSITDWGLSRTGSSSDWTPSSSVKAYAVEDQTGGPNAYLNPGYGGQRYDAEAIYLDWDATNLYVLVVTGLPSNQVHNPAGNSYGAGDILFDFGRNGSFDYGMVVKDYAGLTPGTFYRAGTFNYGLWGAPGVLATPGVNPVALKTGTALGAGQLAYSTTGINSLGQYSNDTHYAIEIAVPLALFGTDWVAGGGPDKSFDVQWTMYCANDVILADPQGRIPEPGTPWLLIAALGAGVLPLRKRMAR